MICPYYQPGAVPCGKEKKCPLLLLEEYVVCTELKS